MALGYLVLIGVVLFGVYNVVRYRQIGDSQHRFLKRLRLGWTISPQGARASYFVAGLLMVVFGLGLIVFLTFFLPARST